MDARDERIRVLEAELAEAHALIEHQRRRIAELEDQLAVLAAKFAALEEKVNASSRNSGLPPSRDPPSQPRHPERKPSGRKQGGQKGHPRHERALVPPEQVTRAVALHVEACGRCGSQKLQHSPKPSRRLQTTEIPKITPEVTEHQLHSAECLDCGHVTQAVVPEGTHTGPFGPRLMALTAALSGYYRLGRRRAQELLADAFSVDISLGGIHNIEQEMSPALLQPEHEVARHVQAQHAINIDETSFRQGRCQPTFWVWVAATRLATLFMILPSRGRDSARKILGSFVGVLCSDRAKAYDMWALHMRQVCWAHLARHFLKFSERLGTSATVGANLLAEVETLFALWHRRRDGTLAFSTFGAKVRPIRARIRALLELGTRCAHEGTAATCRELLKVEPAMWTFARIMGIDPTNNAAERALRAAVIWRKISLGTQSKAGSTFVARMLTVTTTLRQNGHNVLDYLTAAMHARLAGTLAPRLLPASAAQ